MESRNIHEAMCQLDPQWIEEAAKPAVRRKRRLRTVLVAACLCLAVIIPVMAVASELIVQYYHGANLPENLSDRDLDAYYNVVSKDKIALQSLSEDARSSAAAQGAGTKHYGFDSWEEAEEFLGLDVLENAVLEKAQPEAIELLDKDGQVLLDAACSVALCNNQEEELFRVIVEQYCSVKEKRIHVLATAVTELNPNDNSSSYAIEYEEGVVLSQHGEDYLTAAGLNSTIVTIQDSIFRTWHADAWVKQNGFVIKISCDAATEAIVKEDIKEILDAFEP